MAWGKNPWYSPRAIKEPVRTVVGFKTGENSVRYESVNSKYAKKQAKKQKKYTHWDDDDYVDSDFGRLNPKPAYSWTPTRWSSFNFNTFYSPTDNDDDSDLFVKEPENYLTPTSAQIQAKTTAWGSQDIKRIKELARACYLKMIDDREFIAERYKDRNDSNMEGSKWDEKFAMIENVYNTFIPGFTPLEQAIAVNYKYRDKLAHQNKTTGGRHGSTTVVFRRDDYGDPILNSQVEMNPYNENHKIEILDKISIIGNMGEQFKVEKECGVHEVANSPFLRRKIMRDYDQLRMVDIYQRILPNFRTKFLTKDLAINVPVSTSEKKQKIIILLDYSGSMNEFEKQMWVNAILIDRFRYVIKGEAEVYFSYFVSNPSQLKFIHVKNEEDVKKFWAGFSNYPSGSFTDIGRIVTRVAENVESGDFFNLHLNLSNEKPEILIINDGQDEVGYDELPYKVNAISLLEFSSELKDLCVATGGKQVQVTKSNKIFAHSSTGLEEITNND